MSSTSSWGKLTGLIKRFLGIEQLEQDYRKLRQYMSDLIRYLEVFEHEQAKIWQALGALHNDSSLKHREWQDQGAQMAEELRALGEKLDHKVNLEEFNQIAIKVRTLLRLLQHHSNAAITSCNSRCNSQEDLLQQPIDPAKQIQKFPAALKRVVTVLFDAEQPLTYAQVAQRIGKEPSTARSYIHRLRERGFPLEFHETLGAQKRVSLPLAIRRQLAIPG